MHTYLAAAALIAMALDLAATVSASPGKNHTKYKLYYFDARSRAEGARLIFAEAGVPYEDIRVPAKEWPKLKPTTPFGHMPVLEINGEQLGESFAINRYLARQFGLAGNTPLEEAYVDSLADAFKDFFNHNALAVKEMSQGASINKTFAETITPVRESFLIPLQKFLERAGSGYAVGNSVTWADLIITDNLAHLQSLEPDFLKDYPVVVTYIERVRSLPRIQAWIKKRPANDH